jgi:hypothetical protein
MGVNIMTNVIALFPVKSPVKLTTEPVKRTLNDVSPSEWDRVSAQSYKNNPIKMK